MSITETLAEKEERWLGEPGHFWSLDRIAAALGGGPAGSRTARGVSTDTRSVQPGDLFVALRGETYDAHGFLDDAVKAGAVAVVVSDALAARDIGVPVYVVDDTLVALGKLAGFRRRAWGAGKIVVGITGTNGKTSTKELTRAALDSVFEVYATKGNFNNRIGVPLTLLSIREEAEIAVVELGTSLPGEIALLRDIVVPDIAVITSVAEGHLEGLGNLKGVLREKAAIFAGARVAIVPASQPEIAERARGAAARVVTAGLGEGDVAATAWGLNDDGLGWLEMDGTRIDIPLRGVHNLRNAMLAIAVAREVGVTFDDIARGISRLSMPSMRMDVQQLGQVTLINDAYNANPASARAAIELLSAMAKDRQRVLVLGTMGELGAVAERLHIDVARFALDSPVEVVAGIGGFAIVLEKLEPGNPRVVTAPDANELWEKLAPRLAPDAVLLLKASRSVKLERMLPHIHEWARQ